jgi:hypothetical protein
LAGLASIALLAGCDSADKKTADAPEEDPALSGALGDQIMVDPELTDQNQANSGVAAGPGKVELPPELRSPKAISAAIDEASVLAGGVIKTAPKPSDGAGVAPLIENAATAARIAEAAKTGNVDCAEKAEYSMNWVKALPEPLGVYPRGAVQEAAGTDSGGCRLRVVSFATPVSPEDVIDFYFTRVRAAGYDAKHSLDGTDHVLGGSKGAAAYVIFARKLENGITEVDLIASGG